MIAYYDTSALVPLVIDEPASAVCERIWNEATRVVSVRIWYAEARAALAHAFRLGRLEARQLADAVDLIDDLVTQIDHVEVREELVRAAGDLAQTEALRGYDAVHLAALLALAEEDVLIVTGDRRLAAAASRRGVAVAATR